MAAAPKKPVRKAAAPKKTAPRPVPSIQELEERVRQRAYELYLERGREAGHEREDWMKAEAEIAAGRARPKRRT
jgi:hypothetical protein